MYAALCTLQRTVCQVNGIDVTKAALRSGDFHTSRWNEKSKKKKTEVSTGEQYRMKRTYRGVGWRGVGGAVSCGWNNRAIWNQMCVQSPMQYHANDE